MQRIPLDQLNHASQADFTVRLGGIFEHSPWVAEQAAAGRPYASLDQLHTAMCKIVDQAGEKAQLALLRSHPELAGKAAIRGELSASSTEEQKGAGLHACSAEEFARLHALNSGYREKFGFPFIVAVRGHTRASILALMEQRLHHDRDSELREALKQVYRIALLRLQDLLEEGVVDRVE